MPVADGLASHLGVAGGAAAMFYVRCLRIRHCIVRCRLGRKAFQLQQRLFLVRPFTVTSHGDASAKSRCAADLMIPAHSSEVFPSVIATDEPVAREKAIQATKPAKESESQKRPRRRRKQLRPKTNETLMKLTAYFERERRGLREDQPQTRKSETGKA